VVEPLVDILNRKSFFIGTSAGECIIELRGLHPLRLTLPASHRCCLDILHLEVNWIGTGFPTLASVFITYNRFVAPFDCARCLTLLVTGISRAKSVTRALKGVLAVRYRTTGPSNGNTIRNDNFSIASRAIRHVKNAHAAITGMRKLILAMHNDMLIACTHGNSVPVLLTIVVRYVQT
jgi:hypothetical protein